MQQRRTRQSTGQTMPKPKEPSVDAITEQVHPTPERIAKALEYDKGDPLAYFEEHRRPARIVTPWDRYCHPGKDGAVLLEPHQISAGNHYATDYARAGYGRIPSGPLTPSVDNSRHDEPDWVWDARGRITQAQRLIRAHEVDLLTLVLFHGKAAKDWATRTGRHSRAGLVYLRDTLDAIAPVWKLAPRRRK